MKYINSFSKFRLLLEKMQKDIDYYESRTDLHEAADYLVKNIKDLNDSLGREGLVLREFEKKAKNIFYNTFNIVHNFDGEDADKVKKEIGLEGDLKNGGLVHIFTDTNKTYPFILVFRTIRGWSIDTSGTVYRFSMKGDTNTARVKEIAQSIDRVTALKIIEDFNKYYYQQIQGNSGEEGVYAYLVYYKLLKSPVSDKTIKHIAKECDVDEKEAKFLVTKIQKKEEIKVLLSKGKKPEQIAKQIGIDLIKVKILIDDIERQAQAQSQAQSQAQKTEMEHVSKRPDFSDSGAEDIYNWDLTINSFRNKGKEIYQTNEKDRIDFDIIMDKFENVIKKNGYKVENLKKINTLSVSEIVVSDIGNNNSIFKDFLNSYVFMFVISKIIPNVNRGIDGVLGLTSNGKLSVRKPRNSYGKDWELEIVSDKFSYMRRGNDKVDIKDLKTGKSKTLRMGSMVFVKGFYFGELTNNNIYFAESIEYN